MLAFNIFDLYVKCINNDVVRNLIEYNNALIRPNLTLIEFKV